MKITFEIPRKPVSVNAAYLRAGWGKNRGAKGGKGFILSPEARDFKDCAKAHAFAAARTHGWPRCDTVTAVELEFTTYNTRHDADAPVKLAQDAFEGVLYTKDRVVQSVTARKAKDAGPARIVVAITLLAREAA